MTASIRISGLGLALVACLSFGARADDAFDAARKDMDATLGPNSIDSKLYPDAFLASGWAQERAWLIDNRSTIPPKYRALIGVAVSSQIPCQYCIYADNSDARVFGATEQEVREAIMFAGLTRLGSTLVNGNMVDLAEYKKAIDEGAKAMREAIANGTMPGLDVADACKAQ